MVVAILVMRALGHNRGDVQFCERLLLSFRPEEFFFFSSLGDLTQGPSDMRESQHEPVVEIRKV